MTGKSGCKNQRYAGRARNREMSQEPAGGFAQGKVKAVPFIVRKNLSPPQQITAQRKTPPQTGRLIATLGNLHEPKTREKHIHSQWGARQESSQPETFGQVRHRYRQYRKACCPPAHSDGRGWSQTGCGHGMGGDGRDKGEQLLAPLPPVAMAKGETAPILNSVG